jgi:amino acid transporter
MIGIGPLITIPLVLNQLHGALALWAWIVGGVIALCDGLVWAELGSRYPGSGGTYTFLRETFGRERLGRMLAFLFAWQIVLSAPLILASGYIGFAHYAAYLWPALADWRLQGIVASVVAVVTVATLYRAIGPIARIGIALGAVAIGTLAAVILAAASRFSSAQAFSLDPHQTVAVGLAAGLGPALVITLYDYAGYGQSCTVGDEVEAPQRNLPLSVVISILIVGLLYVLLQIGVLGAVPWTSLVATTAAGSPPPTADYVASSVVEHGWGIAAAVVVTIAILVTAFASTYGSLLGFSRIPFAAARDGVFLKPFADLHARGRFPHVALLTIGLLAVPWCFVPLGDVINALIAGLVIIQGLGQIAALIALRLTGERPPYRMWLFPLPVLIATAGWIYIFFSAGRLAIGFGVLTLFFGVVVYLCIAKLARYWPFAIKVTMLLALLACGNLFRSAPTEAAPAQVEPTFTHAAIVERDGFPVFEVDGKPFFVYGAAFFYERLPQTEWARSMRALRSLGINTLDLYIIWNWHETADGQFDFDGHTSPRRDLRTLLKLARQYGFKLIVRPGPVIRNEWRNGGYPAWLLSRPEYGMPLHDLLEGRYPPTATLQNAHSDDAAAEWMRNTTHLRYSERWLRTALREFRPYADVVLAVALDDDQGAYLDNQTWPAPHLTAYLNYLKSVVHSVTGPKLPVFINTYQMKVTASSPVWAMGNWYQSDAYSIGEHDRAQLEFSTGLLQTRPHQPLMYSEFQAGWLLGPDDIRPRPADPSNTLLAMTTLLGMGVRGIVNFPAQDTLYPTGWEAPFANWFYAWDAALGLGDTSEREYLPETRIEPHRADYRPGYARQARAAPTRTIGDLISAYGPSLARSVPAWDASIVYAVDAYDDRPELSAAESAAAVQLTQQWCRRYSITCRIVDLRFGAAPELKDGPIIFLPPAMKGQRSLVARVRSRLAGFVARGGVVVALHDWDDGRAVDLALRHSNHQRRVDTLPGATLLLTPSGSQSGFLTVPNYSERPLVANNVLVRFRGTMLRIPQIRVRARDAQFIRLNIPLRSFHSAFPSDGRVLAADCSLTTDILQEGDHAVVRLLAAPNPNGCRIELQSQKHIRNLTFDESGGEVTRAAAGPRRLRDMSDLDAWVSGSVKGSIPIRRDTRLVYSEMFICYADQAAPAPHEFRLQQGLDRSLCLEPLVLPGQSVARQDDVFAEGPNSGLIFENAVVRLVIAPNAGARAFAFEDKEQHTSVFTTVGALRDDVAVEPPLSKTDRIAKYTHEFPAGMFNRPYQAEMLESGKRAVARLSYNAPDVLPAGAHFERTVTLDSDQRFFSMDERVTFDGDAGRIGQRAVSVTSLAVGDSRVMTTQVLLSPDPSAFVADKTLKDTGNAFGFYDTATHELATIAWRPGDVENATILERRYSIVARLTLAPGRIAHSTYGYWFEPSLASAQVRLRSVAALVEGPSAVSTKEAR